MLLVRFLQPTYEEPPEVPPARAPPPEPESAPQEDFYEDIGPAEQAPEPVPQDYNAYEELPTRAPPQQEQQDFYEETAPAVQSVQVCQSSEPAVTTKNKNFV